MKQQIDLRKIGCCPVDYHVWLKQTITDPVIVKGSRLTMFTGIIEQVGTVMNVEDPSQQEGQSFTIRVPDSDFLDPVSTGSSICVNGVCLTVVNLQTDTFVTEVSQETLNQSTISELRKDSLVNLESSLCVGDELGGHFVFGHVDTEVPIVRFDSRGDFYQLVVAIPEQYRRFVTRKGSIALDGISLTVNRLEEGNVFVRIIPHTYRETALKRKDDGDLLNLEVDMLARYVYNNLKYSEDESDTLTPSDLADAGFT